MRRPSNASAPRGPARDKAAERLAGAADGDRSSEPPPAEPHPVISNGLPKVPQAPHAATANPRGHVAHDAEYPYVIIPKVCQNYQ